jgi:hypothetical protein
METKEIKDSLEIRKARVELYKSIDEARFNKIRYEEERKKMELENSYKQQQLERIKKNGEGWNTPLEQLLSIARAWCIDNEKTIIGSEPAIRSLWDEDEMDEIKARIIKKMREL